MTAPPWRRIAVPVRRDARGALGVLEGADLPFRVERIFYVFDVEPGGTRGAHAHREQHQVLVCLSGGMTVALDDGTCTGSAEIGDPGEALYIPPMVWARQSNFAPGTAYFVLTSAPYDESDYVRNYDEFLAAVGRARG